MDGVRFDAWTRRQFGIAAGGLATLLLAAGDNAAAKKKKKRKKRCRKLGRGCKPGSKRKCCGDLLCKTTDASVGAQKFCCRKEGKGCTINTDCCGELGLACAMDNTCQELAPSDRALKTNFGTVDGGDLLARVRTLPITTWTYTSEAATIRHIGPMAQDFSAAFGVGADDRHIHPIDAQGVAFAAIQGLAAQVGELRAENARLAARVADLERDRG